MAAPLTVGVVAAPKAGVFFVERRAAGHPHGVTVDLGAAFALFLGRQVAYRVYAASGDCTAAVASGEVDVGFMPVDADRAARVAFGPAYYLLESTYAVTAESGIATLADVDRPGVRIIGVADTTTIRAAARSLAHAQPIAIQGVDAAIEAFIRGDGDALALSRDSLAQVVPMRPGARILDGGFQQTTISIAVPPGRPQALQEATAFMQSAKRDGIVRRALDAVGLPHEAVAP
jgi:polar amino acid transport system substrate-binding protein